MKKKLLIIAGMVGLTLIGAVAVYLLFLAPVEWTYGAESASRGLY